MMRRMKAHSGRAQRGVALVQVIITTSIIMLLAIYYLGAAKSQVARAQGLQDKADAYLKHHSAKNSILFKLLTEEYHQMQQQGWNFYAKPIAVDQHTELRMQDLNGLFSLPTMTSYNLLESTLRHAGGRYNAPAVAQSVFDWIDADDIPNSQGAEQSNYANGIEVRNGPIQSYSELALIEHMTIEAEQVLIDNTTIHPTPFFNPVTAPKAVLEALSDSSRAASVLQARTQQGYGRKVVEELVDIYDDEGVNYLVGPGIRLSIKTRVGESFYGQTIEYGIYPYRLRPVQVLARMPQQQLIK